MGKVILTSALAIVLYFAVPWQMKQLEKDIGGDTFLKVGRWYLNFMILMMPVSSLFWWLS